MIRVRLCCLALLALAFMLPARPVYAAEEKAQPHFYQDRQTATAPRMYLTSEELDKLEPMSMDERMAFLNQRRAEMAALSEEEKEERRAERKAAFEALPIAEQVTIKERTQRLMKGFKDVPDRDIQAERAQAKKNVEEFFRNMSPEEKARWDEIRKNNKKWQEKKPAEKMDQ